MPANIPCDACGVHSKVTFVLNSGGVLTLCGHHAQVHAEAIEQYLNEVIYDPSEIPA